MTLNDDDSTALESVRRRAAERGLGEELALIEQMAKELARETSTFEEFAEYFGFANICRLCGRNGLDAEEFSDCNVIDNPSDPEQLILVCSSCDPTSRG